MTLTEYLKKSNQTQSEFGMRIGKSQQSVSLYCSGVLIPPRDTAMKIVEESEGAVTLEDLWGVKIA